MRFGVTMFATDETMGPGEVARLAEEFGFESFFVPEHTHIPSIRRSPFPRGGELPRHYTRTYDPFIALSMAASTTTRLRIGFGVCLVAQRDPITTAKAVASLDHLSEGRVIFGVGAGWNYEEMENHGTDPKTRFDVLTDRVEAMRSIWTEDVASHQSEHTRFEAVWSWPKPRQRPHPPILIGGTGPTVLDRVLDHGDGWMPVGGRNQEQVLEMIEELGRKAASRGRERPAVTMYGVPARPEVIERYADLGVDRCLFTLPSAGPDEVRPAIERFAELAGRFSGA